MGCDMSSVNPYVVLFGKEPLENISREAQIAEVVEEFSTNPVTQQIYMITGVRGSGKTVFMTEVSKQLRRKDNWIVVPLTSEGDLLHELGAALSAEDQLAKLFQSASINLSFFGFGLEVKGSVPITSIDVALTRMIASLKNHGKRLLITIDEVISNSEMRRFASVFQMLVREDLPVFLLMTGLYENIEELQNEKNLTFLYRAPKIYMGALNLYTIARNYQKNFQMDDEMASRMARMTQGYPLAFQILGNMLWKRDGIYSEDMLPEYIQKLTEYAYEKIWSKLSAKDKKIAYGIAVSPSAKIQDIREQLQISTNRFNPYRQRLIRKGIVKGDQWGYLYFALPYFGSFVKMYYPYEERELP